MFHIFSLKDPLMFSERKCQRSNKFMANNLSNYMASKEKRAIRTFWSHRLEHLESSSNAILLIWNILTLNLSLLCIFIFR